jgi:predicted DNA-binding ribbon-helix-helix protein
MTRTQIQLPEPLFGRLRSIAQIRDISVAELIRRGMELYVMTCPEVKATASAWAMPVLRGSGGHLIDPASVKAEATAMVGRFQSK